MWVVAQATDTVKIWSVIDIPAWERPIVSEVERRKVVDEWVVFLPCSWVNPNSLPLRREINARPMSSFAELAIQNGFKLQWFFFPRYWNFIIDFGCIPVILKQLRDMENMVYLCRGRELQAISHNADFLDVFIGTIETGWQFIRIPRANWSLSLQLKSQEDPSTNLESRSVWCLSANFFMRDGPIPSYLVEYAKCHLGEVILPPHSGPGPYPEHRWEESEGGGRRQFGMVSC